MLNRRALFICMPQILKKLSRETALRAQEDIHSMRCFDFAWRRKSSCALLNWVGVERAVNSIYPTELHHLNDMPLISCSLSSTFLTFKRYEIVYTNENRPFKSGFMRLHSHSTQFFNRVNDYDVQIQLFLFHSLATEYVPCVFSSDISIGTESDSAGIKVIIPLYHAHSKFWPVREHRARISAYTLFPHYLRNYMWGDRTIGQSEKGKTNRFLW